jgi:hypothetical protein
MRNHLRRLAPTMTVAILLIGVALAGDPSASADTSAPAFNTTKTVSRVHLDNGEDHVADTRQVTLSVNTTTNLRDRQEIRVRWSGAHPTGGILADQNSGDAKQEEYPMVLLECRGVDSTSVPADQRLSQQTCWTATSGERFEQSYNTAFPPWRIDRYASPDERTALVGQPAARPAGCFSAAPDEYWVPFTAANGTTYAGGTGGCAGMAPEAANVGGLSLPSNTTYGVTAPNGSGQADFDVWTAEDNASLGCSDLVPCSLVAVPVMGISCDATASALPAADQPGAQAADADAACRGTGHYAPGQVVQPTGGEDIAVSGALWWAASNWRNRITVPLQFAPLSNVCDVVAGGTRVDVYGSELLTQATTQWAPTFCLDPKLFRFKHIQTGEPEARNLLSAGNIDAAFVGMAQPGGYKRPVVSAPVAVTGFAVTFNVDDADGHDVSTLRLTPRLLAKLMTESYPAINAMREEYPALADNPLNMTLDPEFIALNPGITKGVPASTAASTLLSISADSDVIHALTAYIAADPDARAWLDGAKDPWGMVVNPNYEGIDLPTYSWPLLDTFEPPKLYASDNNDCLFNNPVPFLPLVAAPLPRFGAITQAMQFSLANSTVVCQQIADNTIEGEKLVATGRQTAGFRFMVGVTSLADADRYQLDTASLLTNVAADAPAEFTSPAGRTFVEPDNASLLGAARLLEPDETSGTWPIPYTALRGSAGADAYPGTMVVYAAVATQGLSKSDASDYSRLLDYLATTGQEPGSGNGQLPPGYLPMTATNGLAALASYTQVAARAVADQTGAVPSVLASSETTPSPAADVPTPSSQTTPASTPRSTPRSKSRATTTTSPSTRPSPSASAGTHGAPSLGRAGPRGSTPTAPPTSAPSPTGGAPAGPVARLVSLGSTQSLNSRLAGVVLPLALLLALVFGVLAPIGGHLARLWRRP